MDSKFSLTRAHKAFERAWESTPPASIELHLASAPDDSRLPLLTELVCIDLELRWKSHAASAEDHTRSMQGDSTIATLTLEDYLQEFPELGTRSTVDALLVEEEFRARTRWGDRPDVDDVLARFPHVKEQLRERLLAIQRELTESETTDGEAARNADDSHMPRTLGAYDIIGELGSGGMGHVYKAIHRGMNREVAIKTLKASLPATGDSQQRFQREVQLAAKLVHPNVVVAHDAGEAEGIRYLVMEYVPGQDLHSLVRTQGPLPVDRAIDCIRQAAEGLQYAHEQGVIHRDVKPANLLLSDDGVVKVLDLGLGRFSEPEQQPIPTDADAAPLTSAGMVMGTVDYMAPEQASETRSADERADIYSLGCTLYYLLTGQRVFRGASAWQTIAHHHEKPVPSLCELQLGLSSELDAVFQKMLAKQPEQRFQTMQDVIHALNRASDTDADVAEVCFSGKRPQRASESSELTNAPASDVASAETVLLPPSGSVTGGGRTARRIGGSAAVVAGLLLVMAAVPGISDRLTNGNSAPTESVSPAPGSSGADLEARTDEPDWAAVAGERDELISRLWFTEDTGEQEQPREQLQRLPAPTDGLDPDSIPPNEFENAVQYDKSGFLKDRLVAVLGSSEMRHWNRIIGVTFTADSRQMIVVSGDGTVTFRDAETGRLLKSEVLAEPPADMAVSPDRESLALRLGRAVIEEWDVSSWTRSWKKTFPANVTDHGYSSDGRWLAVGDLSGTLHLLDREQDSWEESKGIGYVSKLMFCGPENRWLAIARGSGSPEVALFDMESREFHSPLSAPPAQELAVNVDGTRLLVNDAKKLTVWNTSTWTIRQGMDIREHRSCAVDPDGRILAVSLTSQERDTGDPAVFDFQTGRKLRELDGTMFGGCWGLCFSPDGSRLAGGDIVGNVYLWDTKTWTRVAGNRNGLHQGAIQRLTLNSTGTLVASSCDGRRVELRDLTTGQLRWIRELPGSNRWPSEIFDLQFMPDGEAVSVRSSNTALQLLAVETGSETRQLPLTPGTTAHTFSPDGSLLYSVAVDGTVSVSETRHGGVQRTISSLKSDARRGFYLRTSQDGKLLAAAWTGFSGDGLPMRGVQVLDLTTGLPTSPMLDGLPGFSITPDGQSLLTAGDQKFFVIRNFTEPQVDPLPCDYRSGRGGFGPGIPATAINPVTGEMAGAFATGIVHFWNRFGSPTRSLFIGPPGGRIEALSYTPDGRYLLTGNGNGTIYVIAVPDE